MSGRAERAARRPPGDLPTAVSGRLILLLGVAGLVPALVFPWWLLFPWLGDKNGMIRIMNYWMLLAALVAWEGLGRMPPVLGRVVIFGWPLWLGVSLLHVAKSPWMLSC